MPPDTAEISNGSEPKPNGKTRLLTLDDLDRRTRAASVALEARDNLLSDSGGPENCSAARRELIQRAAVLGAIATDCEVRWLKGEPVDIADYLTAVNVQRRLLATLGLERRQHDVTPDLDGYLAGRQQRKNGAEDG